ncbi:hypothetical protein POV27_01895 [Aureisphaera galaxeae]|uniref:hypothetical protein n=1 Tax=Aureisphaera galaxeae TaxID=1538023 RepID=UPI002350948C|nr:hypothetical protein [Aureisphaera galaxeae]MDC8002793.1 hypothetical protein [Aureisphaera galaxeae]
MNSPKQKSNGCLWIFLFGILSLFGWIFIEIVFKIPSRASGILALVLAGFLTYKWIGRPTIKGILVNLIILSLLVFGFKFLGGVFLDTLKMDFEETNFKKEEGVVLSSIVEDLDTVTVYSSHRIWRDNYGNDYVGDFMVRESDFNYLRNHLQTYKPKASGNFWGDLYEYIDQKDGPYLDLVINTFQQIHTDRRLNQMEFAEMVVSCIQDIPYSFIFQDECLEANLYEHSIRRILEDCPECCMGNVPFGIQNPVAFLQNLKGDCDTRTVLIYSILKHFDYDVAILNSSHYRHSILGINLPATGLNKVYRGKKYVVWETTAKYYEAGTLPSNFNDISYWDVVLTSK